MKIAAQLYTVREFMKTPADQAETFRKIRAIGYEAVQYSGAPIGDAKELRKIADDAGVEIICTHIPYDDMKNNLSKVVEEHHILGASYAGIGGLPAEYRGSTAGYVQFAKEYDAIADELNKEGLGLTYHNHWFEFAKYDGKLAMDILNENSKQFQFMLDCYWLAYSGVEPSRWIEKLAGRVDVVHFKDMIMLDENKQLMAEVGEGNLCWNAIINACEKAGVKYYAVEQDTCQRNPFDCLKTSYDNLTRLFEGR